MRTICLATGLCVVVLSHSTQAGVVGGSYNVEGFHGRFENSVSLSPDPTPIGYGSPENSYTSYMSGTVEASSSPKGDLHLSVTSADTSTRFLSYIWKPHAYSEADIFYADTANRPFVPVLLPGALEYTKPSTLTFNYKLSWSLYSSPENYVYAGAGVTARVYGSTQSREASKSVGPGQSDGDIATLSIAVEPIYPSFFYPDQPYVVKYNWGAYLYANAYANGGTSDADIRHSLIFESITLPDGTTPESHGEEIWLESGRVSPNLSVPEPSGFVLTILGLAFVAMGRKRIARIAYVRR